MSCSGRSVQFGFHKRAIILRWACWATAFPMAPGSSTPGSLCPILRGAADDLTAMLVTDTEVERKTFLPRGRGNNAWATGDAL